jgi:uncharacterized protein (DUF1684 family)
MNPDDALDLLDYRRQVFDAYRRVRSTPNPAEAWKQWVAFRAALFAGHRQSAIPEAERGRVVLEYFPYDPDASLVAEVTPAEPKHYEIENSSEGSYGFTRFATVTFSLKGADSTLELYWLEGYAGGIFLPFRDGTSGSETYGAGRYLLDTVKGADLGSRDGRLVLDFNFSYQPSCAYDPRWACPLPPPPNRLDVEMRAGEKLASLRQ